VEQRVNFSQPVRNATTGQWTPILKIPVSTESSSDLLYVVRVNVSNEYDDIEYRIVCNWDDFGKEQSGRPSPPSAVVKPATHCICKLVHQLYICQ